MSRTSVVRLEWPPRSPPSPEHPWSQGQTPTRAHSPRTTTTAGWALHGLPRLLPRLKKGLGNLELAIRGKQTRPVGSPREEVEVYWNINIQITCKIEKTQQQHIQTLVGRRR